MPEPQLPDEMRRMKSEYEPLLPIETKLIWYTFGTGVVLLVALVLISRIFFDGRRKSASQNAAPSLRLA
jgi:hypothetical protein